MNSTCPYFIVAVVSDEKLNTGRSLTSPHFCLPVKKSAQPWQLLKGSPREERRLPGSHPYYIDSIQGLSASLSSMRSPLLTFMVGRRSVVIGLIESITLATACLPTAQAMSSGPSMKVIDSHLHVWANTAESKEFPYLQDPPGDLRDEASISSLLQQMDHNGVDGALIVQPINHKFDHSYVLKAMKEHPDRFKGMLLFDPSLDEEKAVSQLEELHRDGFVGVRFNPYLWPQLGEKSWSPMSQGVGLAVYRRCGELGMPVGIMCFQGLALHYDDILELLKASPDTTMILDHFGFTSVDKQDSFEQLLQLAKYPQVFVKVSAPFRLNDSSPDFDQVQKRRFQPLLSAFGSERLLVGSDFPFVLQQSQAYGMLNTISTWIATDQDKKAIMGGTAEKLFGPWGVDATEKL